jgi:hypothetical protein
MEPIEIPMEDDLVHTSEHPFCSDGTCCCHEDELLIGEIAAQVEAGIFTPEQATDIFAGNGH